MKANGRYLARSMTANEGDPNWVTANRTAMSELAALARWRIPVVAG
jgi:hypothetical protein